MRLQGRVIQLRNTSYVWKSDVLDTVSINGRCSNFLAHLRTISEYTAAVITVITNFVIRTFENVRRSVNLI